MKIRKLIIILFAIAVLVRLFFFIFGLFKMPIAVDESLVGVMSLHILKGEFPIVYWAQSYMGTQESYIDAALIYFFGPNAFSIRIFPFVFSLLFVFFIYKLACRVYNKNVGVTTLMLLAIPVPYLSIASAVVQPDTYVSTCTLGTIALILTYDLVFDANVKRLNLKYFWLGFILGFALWMHLLIISYIGVCVLFLFLKDKLIIFRKRFWIFVGGFIIGGMPLLWYNLFHHFATFCDVGTTVNLAKTISNCKALFGQTLHYLIGLKIMLCADVAYTMELPRILYWAVGLTVIALLIVVFSNEFKRIWEVFILSLKNAKLNRLFRRKFYNAKSAEVRHGERRWMNGTSLLIVMALASIFIFCRSSRAWWKEVRYILPIMSVLPILLAQGLWTVRKFSKTLFYLALSVIIIANIWGNVLLAKAINNPALVAEQLDLQDLTPVIRFLKENNIKHAYANYCISYNLTYATNEEILCTNPYNERFLEYEVPFMKEVRAASNVAYIMHKRLGIKADDFERDLQAIGGGYEKKNLDAYTIFYDFKPPYEEAQLSEIPRKAWQVESNFKNEDTKNAIDGNINTRWGSGVPQTQGMWFAVNLGKVYEISEIKFELGRFITDFPRGYKLEISMDKRHWESVLNMPHIVGIFWEGSHPVFMGNAKYFTAAFAPVRAQYIRITQTAEDSRFDWSIAEIYVYGSGN